MLKRNLLLLLLFVVTNIIWAQMPAYPGLLAKINSGQISVPYALKNINDMKARGIDKAWSNKKLYNMEGLSSTIRRVGPSHSPSGNWNALVLFVKFTDQPNFVNTGKFDSLLFTQTTGTLWDYYNKVSYGNLDIVTVNLPSTMSWTSAPQPYSYYVNGQQGFGNYPQNAQKLVEDVVNAVDSVVDFSKYDNDGDGYVDALFIVHAGSGAEFTGSNNDIWSHSWTTNTPQILDGVKVSKYAMEPEFWQTPGDMTIGVYAHELGHAAFGLPDVYDRDYSSSGLGRWSLMAGGSWNGTLGNSPALPDAWDHIQMGYVNPISVSANTISQTINAVETNSEIYKLWTNGLPANEYYLVENRQLSGFDSALPGDGIIIYHVDENVLTQNDNEWYPGHTGSGHYLVSIMQADGLWNLEKNVNRGDNGDTYPGSTNNTNFSNSTIPDSKAYSFTATGVAVKNISPSSLTMNADLQVVATDTTLAIVSPNGGENWPVGYTKQIIIDALNSGPFKLEYTTDNGATWSLIGNVNPSVQRNINTALHSTAFNPSVEQDSVYNGSVIDWIVPNSPSGQSKIRATSLTNPLLTDQSDNPFNIIPVLPGQFSVQFNYDANAVTGGASNYGAVFIPSLNEFWTSRWNSNLLHRWNKNGTLIEQFTIPGVQNVVGLTYDGTNVYAAMNGSNNIKIIDPVNKTVVGDITAPINIFYITFDPTADNGNGGFWIGSWYTDVTLISRTGNTLRTLPYANLNSQSNGGAAFDGYSPGGPFLWLASQGNGQMLTQISIATGLPTGIQHDILNDIGSGTGGWSGGLFISTGLVNGKSTIGGIMQSPDHLYGYQLSDVSPNITVLYPNGGESIKVGKKINIRWTSGLVDNVKIELTTDNGTTWSTIIASTPAAIGSYQWTVPDSISVQSKIRISDSSNPSLIDLSDNVFSIISSPTIEINPDTLNVTLTFQDSTTKKITIDNSGIGNLKFKIGNVSFPYLSSTLSQTNIFEDSYKKPEGYLPKKNDKSEKLFVDSKVLLLMDVLPWNYNAITTLLERYGVSYNLYFSTSIANIDLSKYSLIIVPSDQTSTFYSNLANQKSKFDNFVSKGGVLEFHAAGWGWNGGNASQVILPGGVNINRYISNINMVVDTTHPIVKNVPNPFNGTSASHSYFSNLVNNTNVIVTTDNDKPDLIEYKFGNGKVIASGQTLEFGFQNHQAAGIILQNMILYALSEANSSWLTFSPDSGTVKSKDSLSIEVKFNSKRASLGNFQPTVPVYSNDADNNPKNIKIEFTVKGLVLTSPNGGEHWKVGTQRNIQWASNGVDNVKIDLTTDKGTTWSPIIASTLAAVGSYQWTVPDNIGAQNKIRVTNVSNTSMFDESDTVFSIITSGIVKEIEPNNTLQLAMSVAFADTVDASVNPIGDIDYYKIIANAGDTLEVYAETRDSSQLYGRLKLLDQNGNYLIENTGFAGSSYQQRVVYILPNTGNYYLRFAYMNNYNGISKPAENERDKIKQIDNPQIKKGPELGISDQGDYRIVFNYFKKSAPALSYAYTQDFNYNSIRLSGLIYPNGLDTKITIDYGTTTSYGNSFIVTTNANSLNEWYFTSGKITGLQGNTTYHYSLTLQNALGTVTGSDYNFTTPQAPDGWVFQNSGVTNPLMQIKFYDANTGYAVGNGAILKTTDGGLTWVNKKTNGAFNAVEVIDSNTVVAVGYSGIVSKTTDGGATWMDQNLPTYALMAVSFKDTSNGVQVDDNGNMFNTTDGGTNWAQITIGVTHSGLYSVKYFSNNTIIASGYNNYVIRSTDGGTTWTTQQLSGNWFWSMSFKDLNNGIMVGYGGMVFKTTDNGVTWNAKNLGSNPSLDGVAYLSNGTVYTVGYQGIIFKSADDGNSWTRIQSGTANNLYGVASTGSSQVYVVGDWGTILSSTNYLQVISPNGGEHWKVGTQRNIQWSSNGVDNVKIELTTDNEATWTLITASTPAASGSFQWTVPNNIGAQNKIRITNVSNTSMFDESDSAFSIIGYGPITEVEPNNTLAQAMSVAFTDTVDASVNPIGDIDYFKIQGNAGDTLEVYAETRDSSQLYGRLRLLDQNGSYLIENTTFAGSSYQQRVVYILPNTGNYYLRFAYMNNYNGISKPAKKERYKIERQNKPQLKKGPELGISDQGDYRIVFNYFKKSAPVFNYTYATDLNYTSTRLYGQIYPNGLDTKITIDYGTTTSYGNSFIVTTNANSLNEWYYFTSDKITGLQANTTYHYKVTLQNALGTVAGSDYNFTTPQAPDGWVFQNSGVTNPLIGVKFYDANTGYAVGYGALLKTTDGGLTWVNKKTNNNYNAIEIFDSNTVVAVGLSGIVSKTTDGGATWMDQNLSTYALMAVSFKDTSNGVLVDDNGNMFKTTDGGTNWTQITIGVTHSGLYTVKYFSNNTIIASGGNNVIRSADGGTTWTSQQLSGNGYAFFSMSFKDLNNGMMVGYGSYGGMVFKTTDNGVTWNTINLGSNNFQYGVAYLSNGTAYTVGGQGTIFKSVDDGNSWTRSQSGTTDWLFGVTSTGSSQIYVVGEWGTILKKVSVTTPFSWESNINISDNGGINTDLTMGQNPSATDGLDPSLGEAELPPLPLSGIFDTRFILPTVPPIASLKDYRDTTSQNVSWLMKFQPGSGGYPITLTWDPNLLPKGNFVLKDAITGSIINVDMKTQSSYEVTNSAINTLKIEYSNTICLNMDLTGGWNIISAPLQAADMSKITLFNTANPLYSFNNGYQIKDTLQLGGGYWLKYDSTATIQICGTVTNDTTVSVNAGWNLLGIYDKNTVVNGITTIPGGISSLVFYGFNNGYFIPDTLISGKGYWLKASQAGLLNIASAATTNTNLALAKVSSGNSMQGNTVQQDWGKIKVTDAKGSGSTLYLGKDLSNNEKYELPPKPPLGVFDVRYSSNTYVENMEGLKEIEISTQNYPVTISISKIKGLRIYDKATGGKLIDKTIADGGKVTISNKYITSLILEEKVIPVIFSLEQNYPNPFNPTTTIKYGLPENARVKLTIYNTLGQKVEEIINEEQEAGYYKIIWNASNYASGVYIYRIVAGKYSNTKKLILLK